jgi:ABC-type bacteriocin/lantibiotic exporter with double-glycine peptidase domain
MLATLFVGCLFAADPAVTEVAADPRCGSKCLYLALRLLDRPVEFPELERVLGEPSGAGYTLAQLEAAARTFGAETLGVQTSWEHLARRPERFACLAHVDGGHFVLFHELKGGGVSVVDPPRILDLPQATLKTRWTGTALLLANHPLTPEESLARSNWSIIGMGALLAAIVGLGWWLRRRRAQAA